MTERTKSLTTSYRLTLGNLGFHLRLRVLFLRRLNLSGHSLWCIFRNLRLLNIRLLFSNEICLNQRLCSGCHSLDRLFGGLCRFTAQWWLKARFLIKLGLVELFVSICQHWIQLGIRFLVNDAARFVIEQTAGWSSDWADLRWQQTACFHHHRLLAVFTLLWAHCDATHFVEIEVFSFWRLNKRQIIR